MSSSEPGVPRRYRPLAVEGHFDASTVDATTRAGRFSAELGGLRTGARSWLRVYPNDDLVIAILGNGSGRSPNVLAGGIANIVLAP